MQREGHVEKEGRGREQAARSSSWMLRLRVIKVGHWLARNAFFGSRFDLHLLEVRSELSKRLLFGR